VGEFFSKLGEAQTIFVRIKGLYRESGAPEESTVPKNDSKFASALIAGWLSLWICHAGIAAPVARYHVDVWRTEEGLPQSSVITMIQTRDGYLWFGTLNGLVRFDGARFTIFDESNTPGLNSSRIVKLFEDSKKNLWIGTETAGAAFVKDGKVVSMDFGQGRREGQLVSICEDTIGAVWLYTADGELGRYHDGKVDVWNIPAERFNTCRALISEKSGLIWVGTDRSLFAIDPKAVRSSVGLPQEKVVPVGKLDFLLASQTEGHWRLVDGFVQKWTTNGLEQSWPYAWPAGTIIKSACEDREGNLAVGTFARRAFPVRC
jgi:ligand-binding sensor domain-containing protein